MFVQRLAQKSFNPAWVSRGYYNENNNGALLYNAERDVASPCLTLSLTCLPAQWKSNFFALCDALHVPIKGAIRFA